MKWIYLITGILCLDAARAAQEDGKALVQRACTKCHALTATTSQRNSRARWSDVVDDMVARGAEVSDAEIEKIIDYLAKNFGPKLKVNTAAASEIAATLGISNAAAAGVVEYRQKNGAFHSLEDLKKVPALDTEDLDGKKDSLDFSVPK